jgi:cytochrome P450
LVPKRWENPTPEMQQSWMGFSLGRRNCVGQVLANAELSVVLAKLCCDYEWSVVVEGKGEYSVTLKTIGTVLKAKKVC